MENPSNKPQEKPKSWPSGIKIALMALTVFVAIVIWQMAFFYGSQQSNDLLLQSPNAADEVIQLRAQLQEARSYQSTLLNVVLTSFAAGFTVLVVVNFAVLFIAQRNYEQEEKRMREYLILEAEKRDAAEAKRATGELAKTVQALTKRFDERIDSVKTEQKEVRGHIGDLLRHSISHYESVASLHERLAAESAIRQRQVWEMSAVEAERDGAFDQAALYRSRILLSEMEVPRGYVSWSNLANLIKIVGSLEKIEESVWVPDSTIESVFDALTKAKDLEGMDDTAESGITIIEAIRERQNPSGRYSPNPPLKVPPSFKMPPTAPLRVPIPKPPSEDSDN